MIEVRQTDVFADWLSGLRDHAAKQKIVIRIRRMEQGNLGTVEPVGEGVSEAKLTYGPGYRLYFVKQGKALVILLCGGDKSTQKNDIKNAKKLAQEL